MILKIYGQTIEDDGTTYHIHIRKPIYRHYVALNSKIINEAIANHRWLHTTCPGAEETINPWIWLQGDKILKEYRIPGKPMTLYARHIGESEPEKREEKQPKLF